MIVSDIEQLNEMNIISLWIVRKCRIPVFLGCLRYDSYEFKLSFDITSRIQRLIGWKWRIDYDITSFTTNQLLGLLKKLRWCISLIRGSVESLVLSHDLEFKIFMISLMRKHPEYAGSCHQFYCLKFKIGGKFRSFRVVSALKTTSWIPGISLEFELKTYKWLLQIQRNHLCFWRVHNETEDTLEAGFPSFKAPYHTYGIASIEYPGLLKVMTIFVFLRVKITAFQRWNLIFSFDILDLLFQISILKKIWKIWLSV